MEIICGDTLVLTPPVGWDTVVVDFRWYDRLAHGQPGQSPKGVVLPVPAKPRMPVMRSLIRGTGSTARC
jgi:hypothetical protein